jgi:hypothetical protein
MKTLGPVFDTDVYRAIEFPLDSISTDFDLTDAVATLHVTKWPNVPGDDGVGGRACTIYAGFAIYETVEDDFEAGTYYAQVRLFDPDDPYGRTVNTEIFRLLIGASV